MDKHKLLVPVVSQATVSGLDAGSRLLRNAKFTVAERSKVTIRLPESLRSHDNPTLTIRFDQGQVLERQAVIPTLLEFISLVSGIVDKFDNLDIAGAK
jgi:hypothetical protein